MNYRHAFHAGNFADVLKHAVLARVLVYLARKESPFRFIDTHAGAGRYDLASAEAKRSPEWREGIARLLQRPRPRRSPNSCAPILKPSAAHDAEGRPLAYPGSPAIAQALMRPQDRIALCEANPDERAALVAALGRDRRLSIVGTDGYVALNAYLPPKERRGPRPDRPAVRGARRSERVERALERALAQMADRDLIAWRPIREARADAHFLNSVAALGAPNILRLELDVGTGPAGAHGQEPLARAGLLVVNPPHTLIDEARTLLPWLAQTSRPRRKGKHLCRLADRAEVSARGQRPCPARPHSVYV